MSYNSLVDKMRKCDNVLGADTGGRAVFRPEGPEDESQLEERLLMGPGFSTVSCLSQPLYQILPFKSLGDKKVGESFSTKDQRDHDEGE